MGTCAADSTVVEIWREQPPSSYSLKINKLSNLNSEKYESRRFLSGGYNWRLVIYPKGNEKDNGNGFISMYVEFDNTSLTSPPPSEVFAYLTFFVYNKKANKYFTIQDVEVKRFNGLRTVWGLSQMLSLGIFNDPKNGYIFEGEQCVFGVDVMVASPFTKWEVVSFDEKLYLPKFSWNVKDFSKLKENLYISRSFLIGGRKWVLKLYPKCFSTSDVKWISIFLHLADNERLMVDERIYTRGHIRVLDPCGSNHVKEKCM
ncbi:Ubiquitin C-terminal hydrolase 12 [Cardamine amara subsp. amara]|uniref:Ubiquitin C-terminal hydrolase 12 n=1 Tax=Cardamine amara subsp. amara TaxID=228776 RepID=A0ABD1C1A8_CARAN